MATIETVRFTGGSILEQTNVSDTVGAGERNEKSDVILIQALCKLVGFSTYTAARFFGLRPADLPEPTGTCDNRTIRAIWGFQHRMMHRLLRVDGKVHPGSYKNRVIQAAGPRMTITLLNDHAPDGAIFVYNTNVIPALQKIAPHLVLARVAP